VTNFQKLIIAILSVIVAVIFVALSCVALTYVQRSTSKPEPPLVAAIEPPSVTPSLSPLPTATQLLSTTATPTETPLPTPTSTRVVTQTPTATPRPTPINCIHAIDDFEISGVVTNEEVETYLRATIPLSHLDHCLRIRYIDQVTEIRATPVSGQFTPVVRYVSVYPIAGVELSPTNIFDTLTHEIGHNVHFNMRIDNLELANYWGELHKQDVGFVTNYARTNEFEDFAESYMTYIRYPQNLLLSSAAKYEFMRVEVFEGYEYLR
jgi:hypothetical protein